MISKHVQGSYSCSVIDWFFTGAMKMRSAKGRNDAIAVRGFLSSISSFLFRAFQRQRYYPANHDAA